MEPIRPRLPLISSGTYRWCILACPVRARPIIFHSSLLPSPPKSRRLIKYSDPFLLPSIPSHPPFGPATPKANRKLFSINALLLLLLRLPKIWQGKMRGRLAKSAGSSNEKHLRAKREDGEASCNPDFPPSLASPCTQQRAQTKTTFAFAQSAKKLFPKQVPKTMCNCVHTKF